MATALVNRARDLAGVLLNDWSRYRQALGGSEADYLALCNRNERLERSPDGRGYRCLWQWTSDLHAPKVLPGLGSRLMQRALAEHPIKHAAAPENCGETPDVSFIIGHRGIERLPHLLATLESIAAQRGTSVECVVVEQDMEARIAGSLPVWVRYVHTPPPAPDMPYCRSWAFNVGARHARAALLVLHDNDFLVPVDYASAALEKARQGWDVANLKRFIFYLGEKHTKQIFSGQAGLLDQPSLAITQNLEGGGSVAITRQAYDRVGGMDEWFIGWGGEDNEFWDRAQTLKVWPYAYLTLVHLWHAAQPGKHQADQQTIGRYKRLSAISPDQRIARLRDCDSGCMNGPRGWKHTDDQ